MKRKLQMNKSKSIYNNSNTEEWMNERMNNKQLLYTREKPMYALVACRMLHACMPQINILLYWGKAHIKSKCTHSQFPHSFTLSFIYALKVCVCACVCVSTLVTFYCICVSIFCVCGGKGNNTNNSIKLMAFCSLSFYEIKSHWIEPQFKVRKQALREKAFI